MEAFNELKKKIEADSHYAWSWHCTVAVCAQDEGVDHETANKAAARFMKLAFDVDTSQGPGDLTGDAEDER